MTGPNRSIGVFSMKVIADLCVIPMGVGTSISKQVAVCEQILAEAGLKTKLHAYGTNIEGDWDAVFAAVGRNVGSCESRSASLTSS